MTELNHQLATEFLQKNNYSDFTINKIAGDASFRSYYRIQFLQNSLILMFAPPALEDTKPFIKVDNFLRDNSFLAPEILAIDNNNGFLLLQDFGDVSYTKFLKENAAEEVKLYKMACDELIKLHQIPYEQLQISVPNYSNAILFREVMLFIDWYLPLKNKECSIADKQKFKHLWFEQFDRLSHNSNFFILRDYHADNLMLLENNGDKQVALLDFQDAVIGSRAYDLVSLLEDARRDVKSQTVTEVFQYYIEQSACDKAEFTTDYNILSLQRNIKILGIFARLSLRDGKNQYLDLLPRVEDHVKSRLAANSSDFKDIALFLNRFLNNS